MLHRAKDSFQVNHNLGSDIQFGMWDKKSDIWNKGAKQSHPYMILGDNLKNIPGERNNTMIALNLVCNQDSFFRLGRCMSHNTHGKERMYHFEYLRDNYLLGKLLNRFLTIDKNIFLESYFLRNWDSLCLVLPYR